MDISRNFDWEQSEFELRQSAAYGHAVRVLTSSRQHRNENVHTLAASLWPAVRLNQIAFLYNSKGAPVAFVTWAYVTGDVATLLEQDPDYRLDISEWNEGDQVWIVDLVAPFGDLRNLLRKLRATCFSDLRRVRGTRRYAGGRRARTVDRRVSSIRAAAQ